MEIIKEFFDGAVKILKPRVFEDNRGFFMENYNKKAFEKVGITDNFVQDNWSLTKEVNSIRGFHFQYSPMGQSKLIYVTSGKILDVVVDLRKDSKSYGQAKSIELSRENFYQIYIPRGMGHGFCTLSSDCNVNYKTDNFYCAESYGGVSWDDPEIGFEWPTDNPILSEQDKNWLPLKEKNIFL